MLCKCGNYRCNYTSHLSPALNGSSEIHVRRFECSDTIEIHDGIIFDIYTGLPHVDSGLSKALNASSISFAVIS